MRKVCISTSSFGKFDPAPINLLKQAGLEITLNPYGRTLSREEIAKLAFKAEGLIAGTELIDAEVLKKLKNLRVISRCGAGLDNVDLQTADGLSIKVFNTPEGPTLAVAELSIGLILALLRKVCLMDRELREGKWQKRMGNLLYGKQVGIIGFGRIGKKVAEMVQTFGVKVVYFDPFVSMKDSDGITKLSLSELLSGSDIVCLHLSYSEENKNLLGKKQFEIMKKGALLINCARGGIVDEQALYLALKEGRLTGAAVDVFELEPYQGPLRKLDNVILTPHIGSYAKEARIKMEIKSVKNLLKGMRV